jgi:hypothetical protein
MNPEQKATELIINIRFGTKKINSSKTYKEIILDMDEKEADELRNLLYKNINNSITETLKNKTVLQKKQAICIFNIKYGRCQNTIERLYDIYPIEIAINTAFNILDKKAESLLSYNFHNYAQVKKNGIVKTISIEIIFKIDEDVNISNIYKKTITVLKNEKKDS